MKQRRPITTMKLFDGEALAAGGSADSVAVDLRDIAQNRAFSVFYTVAGSGTVKLEYLVSAEKDGAYVEPSGASDIGATLAAGSDVLGFSPELAPFLKIRATEDGGLNPATLTLWLNVQ